MVYFILFLIIIATVVWVAVRLCANTWRVLRDPEATRRLWLENKGKFLVITSLLGVLALAVVLMTGFGIGRQVQASRAAFDYLKSKYGIQTNFVMSFSSEISATNKVAENCYAMGYSVGTNSGILTLGRVKNEQGDNYYMVIADEPGK